MGAWWRTCPGAFTFKLHYHTRPVRRLPWGPASSLAGLERIYEAVNQPSSLSLAVAAGPEGDLWSTGSPLPGGPGFPDSPSSPAWARPGPARLCRMSGDGCRPYIFSGSWVHFQAGWVCHPPQKVLEREASVPIFLRGRKTCQLLCSVRVGTRPWGCGLHAAGDDLCIWAYSRRSPHRSWLPHPFSLWLEAWEVEALARGSLCVPPTAGRDSQSSGLRALVTVLIYSSPGHSWRLPESPLSHQTGPLGLLFFFTQ